MDSYYEHIFVMRAVKDPDFSCRRGPSVNSPEEIVSQLFFCWNLERGYRATL
jgi:hypothetical protein